MVSTWKTILFDIKDKYILNISADCTGRMLTFTSFLIVVFSGMFGRFVVKNNYKFILIKISFDYDDN